MVHSSSIFLLYDIILIIAILSLIPLSFNAPLHWQCPVVSYEGLPTEVQCDACTPQTTNWFDVISFSALLYAAGVGIYASYTHSKRLMALFSAMAILVGSVLLVVSIFMFAAAEKAHQLVDTVGTVQCKEDVESMFSLYRLVGFRMALISILGFVSVGLLVLAQILERKESSNIEKAVHEQLGERELSVSTSEN